MCFPNEGVGGFFRDANPLNLPGKDATNFLKLTIRFSHILNKPMLCKSEDGIFLIPQFQLLIVEIMILLIKYGILTLYSLHFLESRGLKKIKMISNY